jgi:hypothetical protein
VPGLGRPRDSAVRVDRTGTSTEGTGAPMNTRTIAIAAFIIAIVILLIILL